jgi:predicted nucleic acid-binding protein
MLLDNSAWARLAHPALPPARVNEIAEALEQGELVASVLFLLEAGYSARDAGVHAELLDELLTLPRVGVDETVEQKALSAQRSLAQAGHHRLPPVDLMTAALADRHELGILHYDRDYDLILERTDLRFGSVWLARRGSL